MTPRNNNKTRHITWIMALSAVTLAGCDREEPTLPTGQGTTAVEDVAEEAFGTAALDAKALEDQKVAADAAAAKAAAQIKAANDVAAAAARASADNRAAAEAKAAQVAADANAAAVTTAASAAKTAVDDTTTKANSLLEQLLQYIKDNKIELANKTLAQLDGMRGSLPASLVEKIDAARTALNAKSAEAMFVK